VVFGRGEAASLGGIHALAHETWAVDGLGGVIMHDRSFVIEPLHRRIEAWAWLANDPKPVYTAQTDAKAPSGVVYPLKEVLGALGIAYLTSNAAYAFAFALASKVTKIKLYGIDNIEMRCCLEFMVCKALHMGITVQISSSSKLMGSCLSASNKLYGFALEEDPIVPTTQDGAIVLVRRSTLAA
jgi:hypothetical protein